MKKILFVCSDIHGFFTEFKLALDAAGFNIKNQNHILIICGDLFDRGKEAQQLLNYLLTFPKNRLIIIRGNHEDLLEKCLLELKEYKKVSMHHITNGTLDTIAQLSLINIYDLLLGNYSYINIKTELHNYFKIAKTFLDFYTIDNYIFVHGWIPISVLNIDLDKCNAKEWISARWTNGIKAAIEDKLVIKNKTIVCGHWHTSYGNFKYHNIGSGEFTKNACFDPFIDTGIIALDACTAFSHKVNIIKLEVDNEDQFK